MKGKRTRLLTGCLGVLMMIGLVGACGGAGGSADGGIGGTGISIGTITRTEIGYIDVNGVTFDTSTSEIIVHGSLGDEDDLAVGQVVQVEGEFDDDGVNGTASRVEIDSLLEGPITAPVDTTNRIITVAGQIVLYDDFTVFEDSDGGSITANQLVEGNVVEVYGFPDASLQIKATRVEKKSDTFIPGTDVIEVKGLVATLDTTQMIFHIFALEIHYSVTTTFENGSVSDLASDRFVEAKGTNDLPSEGFLTASKIEFEDSFSGSDGDLLEVEGNISSVISSTDFVINGIFRVDASSARFEDGTLADIAVDVEIEVEGQLEDRMGELILVAHEVEIED